MTAEPLTAEPTAPQHHGERRHGRLLGIVRRIVAYGRDLVASQQRQNTPTADRTLARSFGTFNLALILARITRGLALAAGLEARVLRSRPARTAPPNPNRSPEPLPPRPVRPPLLSLDRPAPARRRKPRTTPRCCAPCQRPRRSPRASAAAPPGT